MKGVHSQPLRLFLCWFMAWGGLKRLLIFILLRQTAFGIKGRGSKGKGGRAAEVWKTRLEMGVKSQLWAMKENALLNPDLWLAGHRRDLRVQEFPCSAVCRRTCTAVFVCS